MSFDIKRDNLFSPMNGIRYIVPTDERFNSNRYSGVLKFYPGSPLYLVSVALWADRKNLEEKDIEIQVGTYHITSIIEEHINKNRNLIFEICKSHYRPYFILDLETFKIVEDDDFTELLPVRGINTLFRFDNIRNSAYFILVNTTQTINDIDFFSWLRAYVYSGYICLSPLFRENHTANQFMQAISHLCATKGNKNAIYVSNSNVILNAPLNDCGDFDIAMPGKVDRFKQLAEKSLQQMKGKK